jgi:hypothetical protein
MVTAPCLCRAGNLNKNDASVRRFLAADHLIARCGSQVQESNECASEVSPQLLQTILGLSPQENVSIGM